MAVASSKARFHLEQRASELQDLAAKEAFTSDEITAIARKRSTFEHAVNRSGCKSSDYVRYIEYELNVEALRRKRFTRLGIKGRWSAGTRNLFALLARATHRFPGDVGLWMLYVDFARRQKAYQRLSGIFTAVLRLHPTRPELWMRAAQYSLDEQADITAARSYMQRGLRFCKDARLMWLEYAKLELLYISKIEGRRRVLGIDERAQEERNKDEDDGDATGFDEGDDTIALPDITLEDMAPPESPGKKKKGKDPTAAIQKLSDQSTPALSGAVPLAIFDATMKQFDNDPTLAVRFYEVFTQFSLLQHILPMLDHIVNRLEDIVEHDPDEEQRSQRAQVAIAQCQILRTLVNIPRTSAQFPLALLATLEETRKAEAQFDADITVKEQITSTFLQLLVPFLDDEALDEDVRTVVDASVRKRLASLDEGSTRRVLPKLLESLPSHARGESITRLLEQKSTALALSTASDTSRPLALVK